MEGLQQPSGSSAAVIDGGLLVVGQRRDARRAGTVRVVNSTIADNAVESGGRGGGITIANSATTFTLSNKLVVGNTAPGSVSTYQDCYAWPSSGDGGQHVACVRMRRKLTGRTGGDG